MNWILPVWAILTISLSLQVGYSAAYQLLDEEELMRPDERGYFLTKIRDQDFRYDEILDFLRDLKRPSSSNNAESLEEIFLQFNDNDDSHNDGDSGTRDN